MPDLYRDGERRSRFGGVDADGAGLDHRARHNLGEPAAAAGPAGAGDVLRRGTIEFRDPNTSFTSDTTTAPGNIAVDHMYVEYQIPVGKPFRYPLVFMHGGGHTGQFWRTTPDGRQGFFTSFTRRGFSVYSLDAANRGRAGWEPTIRFAVSQGLSPPADLEEADIYSEQAAWTSFRWSRLGTSDPSQFQQTVSNLQALGGDATCIPLPTVGLLGNGHTMAIEKNNEQIADLIETWIRDRPFSRPRPTPPKPPPPRVTG